MTYSVLLLTGGEDPGTILLPPDTALTAVKVPDWNRDLSPWPAPGVFGEDFSGGAAAFLPSVLRAAETLPGVRILAGYSLAGLFALWAAYQTGVFSGIAAASPSVWFDGWCGYAAEARPSPSVRAVSLSVGDREKNSRNTRLKTVEDCLRRTADALRPCCSVSLTLESGSHFADPEGRLSRGIARCIDALGNA